MEKQQSVSQNTCSITNFLSLNRYRLASFGTCFKICRLQSDQWEILRSKPKIEIISEIVRTFDAMASASNIFLALVVRRLSENDMMKRKYYRKTQHIPDQIT